MSDFGIFPAALFMSISFDSRRNKNQHLSAVITFTCYIFSATDTPAQTFLNIKDGGGAEWAGVPSRPLEDNINRKKKKEAEPETRGWMKAAKAAASCKNTSSVTLKICSRIGFI